jgi:hypothetical protein
MQNAVATRRAVNPLSYVWVKVRAKPEGKGTPEGQVSHLDQRLTLKPEALGDGRRPRRKEEFDWLNWLERKTFDCFYWFNWLDWF